VTPEPLWHIGPFAIRSTTMILTWVAMAIVLLVFRLGALRLSVERPGGLQNILELVFDFVNGFIRDSLDEERGRRILFLLVAFLTYILVGNLLGLVPFLGSPTSDPNATFGLAIIVFLLIQYYGVRTRGVGGHLGSQYQATRTMGFFIMALMGTFLIFMEWIMSPVVLALRLFGNIYAGDVLTGLANGIAPTAFHGLGSIVALVASIVIHLGVNSFNTFVDLIQSYIFVMLTLAYISASMQPAGEH
jgi:F-type H+-transporting ATPase subunit a